jgi:hypothetical protein
MSIIDTKLNGSAHYQNGNCNGNGVSNGKMSNGNGVTANGNGVHANGNGTMKNGHAVSNGLARGE